MAARQHGVVTNAQLLALGYSPASVDRSFEAARLHRLHRGVYAVGHAALSPQGLALAAVLASGANAVLSHESAAWLWGLLPISPRAAHVTLPARGHRRKGITIHHSTILANEDRSVVERIPVTATARTLLDLAATVGQRKLGSAIDRAERLEILQLQAIDDLLARCGTHRGARKLRNALGIYRDSAFVRARSERLFLALVKKAGLRRPALNTFVAGCEIDAYWPRERFAVEVDGWSAHSTRSSFEGDRLRQEELKLAGIDSIRVTARRIEREPKAVGANLTTLLRQRRKELRITP